MRRSTLILIGGVCDALDGPLARRSGAPSNTGAAADGIADFISFGVAPAVLVAQSDRMGRPMWALAPGVYMAGAAWRIARYGIGTRTSHVFRGLPLTGAGLLLAAGCQARLPSRVLASLAAALGVAMVSPIRVLSGEALVRRGLRQRESLDI